MIEHKEDREVVAKWGNDLRQTYRTLAQVAEISELDIHLLMNHSLRGVNAGYITRDKLVRGHLRKQQERISVLIAASIDLELHAAVAAWVSTAKVDYVDGFCDW